MPGFAPIQKNDIPIGIVGGTKFARYKQMTVEETVNMMVTGQDDDAALVDFSGYQQIIDFIKGESRAIFLSTRLNELIAVYGNTVYVITSYLGSRKIGTLDSNSGPVHISENFNQEIAIEDGAKIYIYNYGNSTFQKPLIDFIPVYIDFQDSYFIATSNDGKWYLSEPNDGMTWNPTLFQSMQTKADVLQAAKTLDRQLWIMGEKVCELWQDQGLPPPFFPYVRENTISIDFGVLSRETIAEGFGMLVWLAKNEKSHPSLMFTTGGAPQKFSTEGLDFRLSELENPEDSFGFLFQQDGHIMYQIVFPTDNFSIIYDFNTKMFYTVTDENLNYHIARDVVLFQNNLYFISLNDSKLYEMSTNITTYNGMEIPRIRITKHFELPNNQAFIVKRINVSMEQGENSIPSFIDLSMSIDGGESFGNYERLPVQTQGRRKGQITYYRLGRSEIFTFQFRFWSKGRFVVTNATMDIYS